MKHRFLLLFFAFLVFLAGPALPQQGNSPLTKDQVMDLAKFGLESAELAERIKERGIGFEPTADYIEALRIAGAQEVVIQTLVAKSAFAQESGPPLTSEQVSFLVKFIKDKAKVAEIIKDRGTDFEPTESYIETLRKDGADSVVIKALREANPKPLSREQVGKLVAGGVPGQRAAALLRQHGIDFQPDAQYLDTLRLAGADDTLIAAVRDAGSAAMGELVVATTPNADVYLDGTLQGRADGKGELKISAVCGVHTLKVSLKGNKDFERNVTLAAHGSIQIEARLVGITAEVLVGTSPGAEVYVDGASRGRADASGEFSIRVAYGTHQLRISRPGKEDLLRTVEVSKETNVVTAY